MKLERLNVWLQVGASLGLIAGPRPFARRWWRNARELGGWDPDAVRLLDEEIARLDGGSTERWLNALRSAAVDR